MLKNLQKQVIDKHDFLVFLRDLASNLNINLKHMIEDSVKGEGIKEDKKRKKDYHKGKKKVIKKKDLIIQEQNKKRQILHYEDDQKKMKFLFEELDNDNPFESLKNIKTEEGKNDFKIQLLVHFWENKKQFMKYIIVLFFNLKEMNSKHEIIDKVENLLDDYDYQLYMMKEMGHMLPPLDYWNNKEKRFDEWQLKVIQYVHQKESVILKAPTSSGKTFIAMSAGIFHKKVLYVCPAKPVVYQVGAHFVHMGMKVHFLVDNQSNYSYDSKTNIFIGTPQEIENNILSIGSHFDYVVFDEIHNLNKEDDGDIYENLIKLIDCPFLALSATVKNIHFLKDAFQRINPHKNINYLEYNDRFINQQRWSWNGTHLKKIHPMCAFDSMDDQFIHNQLSYTPNDCALLWEEIESVFEDIIDIEDHSPDEYFPKKLISLNDCKQYELFLKDKLIEFNKNYPKEVQQVIDHFKSEPSKQSDIIQFIKKTKDADMFPMLMFHTDENECRSIFNTIYQLLDQQEKDDYPFHYDILEKKQSLYEEYSKKREIYQLSIKVGQTSNPRFFIKEKMELYDRKEKDNYISLMSEYYQSKLREIQKSDCVQKEIQEENLIKEMNQFLLNPDFCYQDIFQKHKDFIFTKSNKPMDADTIREVRREIKKTLGIKIPYESPLFQMLKRGIGLYIENMPDEYNWILQKLLSSKEIGIVISDKTLCLGIDLPVRSSCFLGINEVTFTQEEYLQMSGRAGRRGMDTRGNIIFYGNIDYLSLMRGELPEIKGNPRPIYDTYKVNPRSSQLFTNMIHLERESISLPSLMISDKNKKMIWALREFKGCPSFLERINTIEKELYQTNEHDREEYLLKHFIILVNSDILQTYKSKKITNYDEINIFKKYMEVIMNTHNTLNYQKYMITMNVMKDIFSSMNRMIYTFII